MTTFSNHTMCKGCPFRSTAAPGWLGDYSPEEVIGAIQTEQHFMCHTKINYKDPRWAEKLEKKPHCAGALQMAKILCKSPREPAHSVAVKACTVEPNHLGRRFVEYHKAGFAKPAAKPEPAPPEEKVCPNCSSVIDASNTVTYCDACTRPLCLACHKSGGPCPYCGEELP